MRGKYKIDPDAYGRYLKRKKERPDLKERFKHYENILAKQPEFDTEDKAVAFAVEKTKKGERWTVWKAPNEIGGKWKAVSWETDKGMGPDAADQLGYSIVYDEQHLYDMAQDDIDKIEEV